MRSEIEHSHSTIVAEATPPGRGGVSVVRISGPKAVALLKQIARSVPPVRQLQVVTLKNHRNESIDQCMAVVMPGPHSFTGENVVELHLHGSPIVVGYTLDELLHLGARLARPGEFTQRAFLNGRIDLSKAEAVADVIASDSVDEQQMAARHLRGELAKQVEHWLGILEGVLAQWRAMTDFAEHDLDDQAANMSVKKNKEALLDVSSKIHAIVERARVSSKSGRRIVLCGAPNTGKSTLLNRWANAMRALVSPEPGTTRDPVEVQLRRGALPWSVCDTAGLRENAVGLEAQGAQLAKERIAEGDVIVWLLDPMQPVWPPNDIDADWVVGAKSDLASENLKKNIELQAIQNGFTIRCWISAINGNGCDHLRDKALGQGSNTQGALSLLRSRQVNWMQHAKKAIEATLDGIDSHVPIDLVGMELEPAISALGQILGRDVDEDVLDRIFAEFCIGK